MKREYDHLFKYVIIGNSNVGKSSLLLRFAVIQDDQFNETYLTTIGVDFKFRTLVTDEKNVKLQIWDTAGQERFRTITNAYYKGAHAILLVYDITNRQSFDDINKYWITEVENYADKDVELILIGNKCDDSSKRDVDLQMAQEYARARNMEFFETSAKTAQGVLDAFTTVTKKLLSRKANERASKRGSSSSRSHREDEKQSLKSDANPNRGADLKQTFSGCCPSQ